MAYYTRSTGGIVARSSDNRVEILMLRDKNYDDWTLPKGHVEEGESLEQACKREVYEEAGLSGVIIHQLLEKVERQVRDTDEIKTIYYYLMTLEDPTREFEKTADNSGFEIKRTSINELPAFYLKEQEELIKQNLETIKQVCL